jgi:putative ABC transport system permease protein
MPWSGSAKRDAEIYRIAPAQTLRLPLLGRAIEVFVGGVWRDYGRQFGAVVISREDYQQLGGDFQPTDLALWPRPGQEAQASAWLAPWADSTAWKSPTAPTIRRLSLSIFDKSFAVTYALEAAAMLIGLFGLAVTLAASVWLRARELATLGALGFDRRMLSHAVMLEGALIAAVGLLIGLACGIAIGAILTHVVNPQAFHWRMALAIPWPAVCAGAGHHPGGGGTRQSLCGAPGDPTAGRAGSGQRPVGDRKPTRAPPQLPVPLPCSCRAGPGGAGSARRSPMRR